MKKSSKIFALTLCLLAGAATFGIKKAHADACTTYCVSNPLYACVITYLDSGNSATCYYYHSKTPNGGTQ